MNEHVRPDIDGIQPEMIEPDAADAAESSEAKEGLAVDDVYFAGMFGQENQEQLALYTPQAEIAATKQGTEQEQLEKTSLTLQNPLHITHKELVKEWLPSSGAGWSGMEAKIREAVEAGYDGIAVEPDPTITHLVENGSWPSNSLYTYLTESYFKFNLPETEQES